MNGELVSRVRGCHERAGHCQYRTFWLAEANV